jgi:hypothetical protein
MFSSVETWGRDVATGNNTNRRGGVGEESPTFCGLNRGATLQPELKNKTIKSSRTDKCGGGWRIVT